MVMDLRVVMVVIGIVTGVARITRRYEGRSKVGLFLETFDTAFRAGGIDDVQREWPAPGTHIERRRRS